jgi:GNAT superfamily N-acetyltransferase
MSDQLVVRALASAEDAQQAFCCMAEVPTPWPEALQLCRAWIGQNLGRHIAGYHALDESGAVIGQLYYAPADQALVPYEIEDGVTVIYCEWVQRRHQGVGVARRLFATLEADAREQGSKGIMVEGTEREEFMHYRHYLARGFQVIHEAGDRKLLYLPLHQPRAWARPLAPRLQPRRGVPVEILILTGYLCPFETAAQLLLLDVAREFGDKVIVRQEPLTRATLERYGVASGIFINGRRKLTGAASEEEIRQAIREEM